MQDIPNQITRSPADKTDAVIRSAILKQSGKTELVLADVARFGVLKIYPDGTEIFAYDGLDLIRFFPIEISTVETKGKTTLTAKRNYQLLT